MSILSNVNYSRRQVMFGLVALFGASMLSIPFLRSNNSNLKRVRKVPLHSGDSIFAPRNDASLSRWLTGRQ
jgi:hypothetical protein